MIGEFESVLLCVDFLLQAIKDNASVNTRIFVQKFKSLDMVVFILIVEGKKKVKMQIQPQHSWFEHRYCPLVRIGIQKLI